MRAKKAKMMRRMAAATCSRLGITLNRMLVAKDNGTHPSKGGMIVVRNQSAVNATDSVRFLYREYKKEYKQARQARQYSGRA